MALNPSILINGFMGLAAKPPKSVAETAHRWATIYDSYGQGAMAGLTAPLLTGLEKQALEGILLTALSVPVGLPATVALAWGTGVVSYWSLPPVVFVGAPLAGAVAVAAGALATIVPLMTACLLVPTNTAMTAAIELGTALDLGTRSILVLLNPGGLSVPLL